MRIGLDGQNLVIKEYAGPEKYAFNLYKNLFETEQQNEYIVYLPKKPENEMLNLATAGKTNVTLKVLEKPHVPFARFISWTQMILACELIKNPVDVFFSPFHTLPGFPTILNSKRFKPVSMIHGLEFKTNKAFRGKPFQKFIHPLVLRWVVATSKKIIVPSETTRGALTKAFGVQAIANKTTVIPEGVSEIYHKKPPEEIAAVRQKYSLGANPYLLAVSTIQPRKNYPKLIEAFSHLSEDFNLAIVGKKGWGFQASLEAPRKFGVTTRVKFLYFVPEEDMPALYSGAAVYVSCSVDEGFGLTLIEALACETKAVVSNIQAYKEIAGKLATYVDPKNTQSIIKGVTDTLSTPLALENNLLFKERAEMYKWQTTAKKVSGVLYAACNNS